MSESKEGKSGDDSRDNFVKKAKLAEQAERYEDMVKYMNRVVEANADLSVEERNLLSVAYKNVIGSHRAAFRVVQSIYEKEKQTGGEDNKLKMAQEYVARISDELERTCGDILDLIDSKLVGCSDDAEGRVFYHKMAGDYNRYLAEVFAEGDKHDKASEKALKAYDAARDHADRELPPTHPIRLGLALNFSVFYFEILEEPEKACQLAKAAFDKAIAELDTLSEESYKDSTLIMQLLRDNLTLWTTDDAQDA